MNSCTGRSLLSPFLSSLKLILGNSFQVSVIRIEYARYSCEYRIRKSSQEYFKALPSLIFLPLSLNPTVQGVLMCIPQSAVLPLVEPFRTKNSEEHHSVYCFPFRGEWRLRNTRKQESSSYPAKFLMWGPEPTSYTYLLIGEKSKDGETYGFYNNSNGEWY